MIRPLLLLCALTYVCTDEVDQETPPIVDVNAEVRRWLEDHDREYLKLINEAVEVQWAYNTNITEENAAAVTEVTVRSEKFSRDKADEAAAKFNKWWYRIEDDLALRQLSFIIDIGIRLDDAEQGRAADLGNAMEKSYSEATICPFGSDKKPNCTDEPHWSLEPDLKNILRESDDYELLEYIWKSWFDNVGQLVRPDYLEFVKIKNMGARKGGYPDMGAVWRSYYRDPTFRESLEKLMHQLLPLYEQMHAYVRRYLINRYSDHFGSDSKSALPAHLFGNMWSQTWENLFDETAPFPDEESVDVTETMLEKGYDPLKMFQDSDDFFASIGQKRVPPKFWEKTLMVKPDNISVVCHASAWDFYTGEDYRVKQCTRVVMDDYFTVHHEMGHIQYFMQYAHLPGVFRSGANPGFHEAIGDVMALSVQTPKHLRQLGLLSNSSNVEKEGRQQLNYLYYTALSKIAFLPFGYLVDQWRWDIFAGINETDWNNHWNDLRFKFQGIFPPVDRSNPKNLDPGAKYHVPANVPYIRYFVSFVIQFQFYESLCNAAGHSGPLSQCDFYNNEKAGALLSKAMQYGASRPWQVVMDELTGTREMDAGALLRYFEPLITWLEEQNQGECFGWGYEWPEDVFATLAQPRCRPSMGEFRDKVADAKSFLNE